ncbi:hypothetical protein THTE_0565 [Thermogutta terrifontis]|uniref:Uncharacterized protein n=1 Tax=Thermogutta terrifontis TaxID=1331910 RepID=A0A286RB45_9BACT|nr:hypothetical protein THTE_0565 [Thermogutta terrifontis]
MTQKGHDVSECDPECRYYYRQTQDKSSNPICRKNPPILTNKPSPLTNTPSTFQASEHPVPLTRPRFLEWATEV